MRVRLCVTCMLCHIGKHVFDKNKPNIYWQTRNVCVTHFHCVIFACDRNVAHVSLSLLDFGLQGSISQTIKLCEIVKWRIENGLSLIRWKNVHLWLWWTPRIIQNCFQLCKWECMFWANKRKKILCIKPGPDSRLLFLCGLSVHATDEWIIDNMG